ncbi:MAG: glutaredoxin family protein [Candidatus Dormibacteria bacterium]
MAGEVTVFVRAGDPQCEALRRWLDQRGVEYLVRDVTADPSASAILFGRLGRIAVPALLTGERLIVGFDPVQLARYLPGAEASGPPVSFGAAVRSVTVELARARGLPAAYGVEVGSVHEGSPAAAAGIRPKDIIAALGAYTLVGGADQFRTAVAARRPGDSMALTVVRADGSTQELTVEFPRELPGDGNAEATQPPPGAPAGAPAGAESPPASAG